MKDHETQENAAPGGTCAADGSIPLRDWFAAQALHAAVDDYTLACRSGNAHGKPVLPKFSETDNGQAAAVARTAYALADAMLAVRESNAQHQRRGYDASAACCCSAILRYTISTEEARSTL